MPAPAVHTLTSKMFTRLARAVQEQLRSQGVNLPKGSYCHVLEATARGLGFSSKSDMDTNLSRNSPLPFPDTLDELAASSWLIRSGVRELVPGFLTKAVKTQTPPLPTQETATVKTRSAAISSHITPAAPPDWLLNLLQEKATIGHAVAGVVHRPAEEMLPLIPDGSVDLVLTDPPYFIDKMGDDWHKEGLKKSQARAGVVGTLPVGMKFDPAQGKRLQEYLLPIFDHCYRILKPGGFLISFSQARLYHRMGVAAEDAGFEIRDMLGWTYEGQAKAFSQEHFVRKMKIDEKAKNALIESLGGRKTPQLKPMIEPMVFGQKPRDGTFIENWGLHRVGLVDTSVRWDDKFPGNLMNCRKPSATEKGEGNNHLTVKPQKVLQHLIKLFTVPGAVVVDPFAGSSSTQLAALLTGRHAIGSEREREDFETSRRRLLAASTQQFSDGEH